MEVFSLKLKQVHHNFCLYYICHSKLTIQDNYWRFSFSATLLTVNSCIKVRLDLQAEKSPVVVKGPFFTRVVNPRYRIRGTNV
jgi:hypothetical protein